MKIHCLHELAEIAPLRDRINALNLAAARPDPFSTYEHLENVILRGTAFRRAPRPRIWFMVAVCGDELAGFLALKETRERMFGLPVRRLDFLVGYDGDRPGIVATPERLEAVRAAIFGYLLERRGDWDYAEFQYQDASSPLLEPLLRKQLRGCAVRDFPNWDNCTITVRWPTIQQYVDALAGKFRTNLKRQMRKLHASGTLELLSSSDPGCTPALLELFCAVEARSWKAATELALGRDPARLDFHRGLLDSRQPMRVSILILMLDRMPIAGFIIGGFEVGTRRNLYGIEMAYDRALHAVAPGSAILMLAMYHAISNGYASINLLCGFGYYKSRWLADVTTLRSVLIYRVGGLPYWRRRIGDLARRWRPGAAELENRYNAAKRTADFAAAPETDIATGRDAGASTDASAYAHLMEQVRRGAHELLGPADLTRILPFLAGTRASRKG
ncbi:MAG: GNAT family N-acetyltransferase [Gammaproteobacteria bacterium]|nr:GNAT family N-acetyltransferase [Gammaproteobacteria bacterium]